MLQFVQENQDSLPFAVYTGSPIYFNSCSLNQKIMRVYLLEIVQEEQHSLSIEDLYSKTEVVTCFSLYRKTIRVFFLYV